MPVVANAHDLDEDPSPLGFVLSEALLVTIRYTQLRSFETVALKLPAQTPRLSSVEIFSTLVEEMVDVSADVLEELAGQLDSVSKLVFKKTNLKRRHPTRSNKRLHNMLVDVGNIGERLSRVRDSLLGLQRMLPFVSELKRGWITSVVQTKLESVKRDLLSLTDYEMHLYTKVQFLLDAVLGFINTKQNDTFTVLTIVSVVGIPPTLIASIYGMNFKNMPELDWAWGYQFGLGLILLSTIVPILWLKWRGWF
jgi:magnesium transporter